MTLIGRTQNGTRIVEISTEEFIALMAAAKILENLRVEYAESDIPAAQPASSQHPRALPTRV